MRFVNIGMMRPPEQRRVDDPCETYFEMKGRWELVRDMAEGWSEKFGRKHLMQHPKEETDEFNIRADRPVFVALFSRTITGLAGLVFRRDPQLSDDVPEQIREHWEDIDLCGTHGAVFAREAFIDILTAGHGGLLVDAPATPRDMSLEEERQQRIRPYWVYVPPERILSWRYNGLQLSQLVIHEPRREPAGDFGDVLVDYFRVYKLVGRVVLWDLWKQEKENQPPQIVKTGAIANIQEIPFVPVYARKRGNLSSLPPLYDLATLNLNHFRVSSDLAHSAHLANVPFIFGKGMKKEEFTVSPNKALFVPDANADVRWIETTGSAIGATREMLKDLESAAAVLGLETLKREARIPETAMARRLDRVEQDSTLAATARNLQDAIEQALLIHARMLGMDDGGSVQFLTDFSRLSLGSDEIRAYSELVKDGQLSLPTLFDVLIEGGSLPSTFTAQKELDRLADNKTEDHADALRK